MRESYYVAVEIEQTQLELEEIWSKIEISMRAIETHMHEPDFTASINRDAAVATATLGRYRTRPRRNQ